jgi:hypothetical protein
MLEGVLSHKYTLEKITEQSRMDNPEKLAILGPQDTRRRQAKQKHNTIWQIQTIYDITQITENNKYLPKI